MKILAPSGDFGAPVRSKRAHKKYRRFTGRKSAKIQYKALSSREKKQSTRNRKEQARKTGGNDPKTGDRAPRGNEKTRR
jgi:hypothetical protein